MITESPLSSKSSWWKGETTQGQTDFQHTWNQVQTLTLARPTEVHWGQGQGWGWGVNVQPPLGVIF